MRRGKRSREKEKEREKAGSSNKRYQELSLGQVDDLREALEMYSDSVSWQSTPVIENRDMGGGGGG